MKKKRFLFIMDPLDKLWVEWDTSLILAKELAQRGHEIWAADSSDLWTERDRVFVCTRQLEFTKIAKALPFLKDRSHLRLRVQARRPLESFDRILIRKDPPFDLTYLALTHLLESAAKKVPVMNHPRGIRNTNEKLSILLFPNWIPETVVSQNPKMILAFQRRLAKDVVIKPLDQKAGEGVFLLKRGGKKALGLLEKATFRGEKFMMAQRFLEKERGDKRILILNGKPLAAFRKCPGSRNEFRANLSLGGTFHPAIITRKEKQLISEMRPYLLKEGLYFVGIDVMEEKLLEINVTSPAGLVEAKLLYPRLKPVRRVADFLEQL